MPRALKEEYVPAWWREWRDRDQSDQQYSSSHVDVPVDIVAVQGLASTYEWTWTKENLDGSKSMWLRDFLPQDLPNARIMTFEYDSRWLQDPAMVNLEACGDRLLESLLWDRTHRGSQHTCPIMSRRPLILLGHSFGGLVIKQALVTAANRQGEDYASLLRAIAGVMFLGTPHSGSAFAKPAYLQAMIRQATGHATNIQILRTLQVKSEVLYELQEKYENVLNDDDHLSGLMPTYFFETKALKIGIFETAQVVDKDSACFGCRSHFDEIPLDANHMELNKFGSRHESNYMRVMQRLLDNHNRAAYTVEARLGKHQYLTTVPGGNVMEIRQWLSAEVVFSDLYNRRQRDRLIGTCEWAGELDEIRNWVGPETFPSDLPTSHRRFVWVSGKAGSGKSVLAVWLYDKLSQIIQKHNWSATDVSRCSGSSETVDCQHHTVTNNKAVLYFPISKTCTPASVIKTLIHQLLLYQPTRSELQDYVIREKGYHEECTAELGMRILTQLLQFFPVTYIIIDGLDECNDPNDLIHEFKAVKNMGNVRLLFLARQDQELQQTASQTLTEVPWQDLDISYYNTQDIHSFIQAQVASLSEKNALVATEAGNIAHQVFENSRGMFQWVKLIMYALEGAKTKHEVLSTINHFPKKLNEAYTSTFKRLSQGPGFNSDRAILVLKLLSVAYRSLTWQELAMAVKLQQKVDEIQHFGAQSMQDCITFAEQELETLQSEGPNYFTFLGPLLDIRCTTVTEPSAKAGDTIERPVTIVTMCHHSLQQWIDGSESLVDRDSDLWKQYHFTRIEAHHALASLSLVMLTSKSAITEYLRTYYAPDNARPFVNYSGKHVFAHVRAIGTSAPLYRMNDRTERDGPQNKIVLFDMAKIMLKHNLDIAAAASAALSKSLADIKMKQVRHLPKVVAVRRLKTVILPASKSLLEVTSHFNEILGAVRELMMARKSRAHDYGEDLISESPFHDTALGSLGPELDSNVALRILETIKFWASGDQHFTQQQKSHWEHQVKLICETTRHLRKLAILLSVDPVRAWIYAQVGETGIAPLVALTYASEGSDAYLAASLLDREIFRKYDLAEQFSASPDHPYYGHITATSHELSTKGYNGFDTIFYKKSIMQYYRISRWEWTRTRMLIAAMEMGAVDPYWMNHILKEWIYEHGLSSNNARDAISAMQIIDQVPFQEVMSRVLTLRDRTFIGIEVGVVYSFKYLTHVYPPLEGLFADARWLVHMLTTVLRPTLQSLFSNRTDFLIALIFYFARNRYAPWVFWNIRSNPLIDLKGIIRDPKDYIPVYIIGWPFPPGWISLIVIMAQEIGFWYWIIFGLFDLNDANTIGIDQNLERRTSFRIDWANTDTSTVFDKIKRAFLSHGPAWFNSFTRIICVEKLFLYSSYWVFDILRDSAQLLMTEFWNWSKALSYAMQMVGFVYGRTAGLLALLRMYFWLAVINRYKSTSLAGLVYRYIALPAWNKLLGAFKDFIQYLVDRGDAWTTFLDSIEEMLLRLARQLDFRILVFCTAAGICAFAFLFRYMTADPLGLQSAARSCNEAERLAKKAAGTKDPMQFLGWHSNSTDHLMLSFNDQLVELDREL